MCYSTALGNTNNGSFPDRKVHGANIGPIWGRQDPDGPDVGPMNFAIWIGRDATNWWYIITASTWRISAFSRMKIVMELHTHEPSSDPVFISFKKFRPVPR